MGQYTRQDHLQEVLGDHLLDKEVQALCKQVIKEKIDDMYKKIQNVKKAPSVVIQQGDKEKLIREYGELKELIIELKRHAGLLKKGADHGGDKG